MNVWAFIKVVYPMCYKHSNESCTFAILGPIWLKNPTFDVFFHIFIGKTNTKIRVHLIMSRQKLPKVDFQSQFSMSFSFDFFSVNIIRL